MFTPDSLPKWRFQVYVTHICFYLKTSNVFYPFRICIVYLHFYVMMDFSTFGGYLHPEVLRKVDSKEIVAGGYAGLQRGMNGFQEGINEEFRGDSD